MMIQPEQSLSALPNLVPEDSFCSSGEEGSEEEEVEEWADIDLDLDLWHLDLEEVANWGIGEVGVHAMETECHQQAPAKGSISLSMRMSSPGDVGWVVVRSVIREFLRLTAA